MIIQLKSALHTEDLPDTKHQIPDTKHSRNGETPEDQVIHVLTGGTESLFLEKVKEGVIDLTKPIYLVASGQSNSLAASLEILAYINQHGGRGMIVESN